MKGNYLFELKKVILDLIERTIKGKEAARKLECSIRSIWRYKRDYLKNGPEGLRDKRGGNNKKL